MKKIILLFFAVFLLASCAVKYPYRNYSSVIDFTEVITDGFFITESNSVSFQYDPLGSVTSVVESGYEVLGSKTHEANDDVYSHTATSNVKFGRYIYARAEDVISELISAAQSLGANGIINLKITYTPSVYDKYGNVISPSAYIASGMAIKRK
jgi:uncharacterized protein YbjQ (UPF0145 family)